MHVYDIASGKIHMHLRPPSQPAGFCPTGWTDTGAKCYKRFATAASHGSAGQTCHAEGGGLAVFEDLAQNDHVAAEFGYVNGNKLKLSVLNPFPANCRLAGHFSSAHLAKLCKV